MTPFIERLLCKTVGCTSVFAYIPWNRWSYRVCHWYAWREDEDPRVDQLWSGHHFEDDVGTCHKCGLDYWSWFEAPEDIKCT